MNTSIEAHPNPMRQQWLFEATLYISETKMRRSQLAKEILFNNMLCRYSRKVCNFSAKMNVICHVKFSLMFSFLRCHFEVESYVHGKIFVNIISTPMPSVCFSAKLNVIWHTRRKNIQVLQRAEHAKYSILNMLREASFAVLLNFYKYHTNKMLK